MKSNCLESGLAIPTEIYLARDANRSSHTYFVENFCLIKHSLTDETWVNNQYIEQVFLKIKNRQIFLENDKIWYSLLVSL